MDLHSHRQRLFTAALLVAVPAAAIALGGAALTVVLALFAGLGVWEFQSMFWPGRERLGLKCAGLIASGLVFFAFASGRPVFLVLALLAGFWTGAMAFLRDFARPTGEGGQPAALVFPAGLLYLPAALQLMLAFDRAEIVLVLVSAAASDTGAYYAGHRFGKAKLWPAVSPGKTWAGSYGGLASCVLAVTAFGLGFGQAPWWVWLLLGAALNVAAQLGDLFESALKRRLGVKDSGAILPGHGGVLDRIDSLLFAIPVYALVREIHPLFQP